MTKFIHVLEAGLENPIFANLEALTHLYRTDTALRRRFIRWVVREQGWTHSEEALGEELDRAAKLSAYVLVNKLVFYEVLRRSFPLPPLRVAARVASAADTEEVLRVAFTRAMEVSNDYETIFQESFGSHLAFLSDQAVPGWRHLIEQIHAFDFTQLNYDIIGRIFERLIGPRERHQYGQHYTRPDVVDLINTFCVRRPDGIVLDPACGGGTFLVRAYARKRWLSGGQLSHAEQLRQLFGIDISEFAQHLASINLAVRHLVEAANYPWVAHKDYFDVRPGQMALQLPSAAARARDLRGELREAVPLPAVDAVVGNPPYIRQEDIPRKDYIAALVREEHRDPPVHLSGRSDIYVYFFVHAAAFLKPDGYLGFLTSNSWMDTDYGMKLQRFFLDHFEIVAVIESAVEQWFTEARVATAISILRRQPDRDLRRASSIRFVQVRVPLAELIPDTTDEDVRQRAVETIRDRILASAGEVTEQWRIRVINQGWLEDQGYQTPETGEEPGEAEEEGPEAGGAQGGILYVGAKWGQFLRAPDIFFKLLDRAPDRFVALGDVVLLRRGMTTGANEFFYVHDITDAAIADAGGEDRELYRRYGVRLRDIQRVRVCRAGDGSVHLIETVYLSPVVFNLMEVDTVTVDPSKLRKKVLLVNQPRSRLTGHVRRYIEWGERQGYNDRTTCAARAGEGREWFDLRPGVAGKILWSKSQKYRHIVPINEHGFPCDNNLYHITPLDPSDSEGKVLCAILNSSISALFKHQYGRSNVGESTLKTEIVDMRVMRVVDPRQVPARVRRRLEGTLQRMAVREIGHLQDDLDSTDRRELDDGVLEAMGVANPAERSDLIGELYRYLGDWYRSNREAELRTVRARGGRPGQGPSPRDMAAELWEELEDDDIKRFPEDFHGPVRLSDVVDLLSPRVRVGTDLMRGRGFLAAGQVQIGDRVYDFGARERAEYVRALVVAGHIGRVRVPRDPDLCGRAVTEYMQYLAQLERKLRRLAEDRTQDPRLVQRVVDELMRLGRNHRAARPEPEG